MKKPSTPVLAAATLIVTLSGCPVAVGDVASPDPVGLPAQDTGDTDDQTRLRTLPVPAETVVRKA